MKLKLCLSGVLILMLLVSGCATAKLTRLDNVGADEAIGMLKVKVIYNGKDISKGCNLLFNVEGVSFMPKYQFGIPKDGYIFGKFLIGKNTLNSIIHNTGLVYHGFKPGEITCDLKGGGVINYIGDLTFNWNGVGTGSAVALEAARSTIVGNLIVPDSAGQGKIVLSVDSNVDQAQEALQKKFPGNQKNVTPALMEVNPQ